MATSKKKWSPELRGVGGRAKHARERAGLGQREAAEKLSMQNSSLVRLEAGRRLVDIDKFIEMARLYDVPLDWLLAEDVPLPPRDPAKTGNGSGDRRRRVPG